MQKIVKNEIYLDTQETIARLEVSKPFFYTNIVARLRVHHFDGKRKPWYKETDVIDIKEGKSVRKADIPLRGMFGSWEEYARTEYGASTDLRSIEIATLPKDAVRRFDLSEKQQFVKRSRLSRVGQVVICTWDTYYPMEWVSDILEDLKNGTASHIVEYIKEKHGLIVGHNRDIYGSRMPTLDEENLFRLAADEPLLTLQRASYTQDSSTLVLYSDMALLGSWFIHEHEYDVPIWNKKLAG